MSHGVNFEAKSKVAQCQGDSENTQISHSFGGCDMTEDSDHKEVVVYANPSDCVDSKDGVETGPSVTFCGSFGDLEGEDVPIGMRFGPVSEMDAYTEDADDWSGEAVSAFQSEQQASPVSYQALPSLNSARTAKSVEGSCMSKESILSLNNLKRSNMSQHLERCKDVAFKQRIRTSGILCSLGLFFVICGVIIVVFLRATAFAGVIRSLAVAFLLFGLVSFLLALLPTDSRAVPAASWILFALFFLFGVICLYIGVTPLFLDLQSLEVGLAVLVYATSGAIVFSGLLFFLLAVYLMIEVCRPRRNRHLLSRMWYASQLFFAIVMFLTLMEAFSDLPLNGPAGLAWLIATAAATLCMLTARSKEFRSKVQTCLGARGESAGSAAAVAGLVGRNSVEQVLEMARCSFFTVKADRLKMEHMVTSEVDPRLSLGKLARRTRLGEADAFISHSWTDDPLAKWNAIQGWRKRFKRQHQAEPRLWIDKYCIDQNDFKNSLACLPVYLASCSKMVVICGETYLTRLWCVVELFVFLEMGGSLENLEVIILPDPENRIANTIDTFDPSNLQCSQAQTADVLQSVLEAGRGGLDALRDLVHQRFTPKAARRRKAASDISKKPEKAPQLVIKEELRRFAEDQTFSI